ncbi:hypothetical protein ABZ249_24590 [Nocardiopsis sp. NPDC006139]|uniref:hypothetical protein n=1 Tax=Nocardiopsis sp. NPDC006139 TaxID=3154578 RepID=UPI0033BAF16E
MDVELIISPRSERVHQEPADAAGWTSYAVELRQVLEAVIGETGVDSLEVGDLLVAEPPPDRYLKLYNGAEVSLSQTIDLAIGMAAGRGPYCQISIPGRLRIESGWEGAVHLYTTRTVAADLEEHQFQSSVLRWCDAAPEPSMSLNPVDAVADEGFWTTVARRSDRLTLLCERWAYGAYGCLWFRVTRGNAAEVARLMRPRSLICVVGDPELRPRAELLEDDFTAFMSPLLPGELVYRAYPGGADTLSEVTGEGFSHMLADRVMSDWCAVVPDPDGVNRARWERPGAP